MSFLSYMYIALLISNLQTTTYNTSHLKKINSGALILIGKPSTETLITAELFCTKQPETHSNAVFVTFHIGAMTAPHRQLTKTHHPHGACLHSSLPSRFFGADLPSVTLPSLSPSADVNAEAAPPPFPIFQALLLPQRPGSPF